MYICMWNVRILDRATVHILSRQARFLSDFLVYDITLGTANVDQVGLVCDVWCHVRCCGVLKSYVV